MRHDVVVRALAEEVHPGGGAGPACNSRSVKQCLYLSLPPERASGAFQTHRLIKTHVSSFQARPWFSEADAPTTRSPKAWPHQTACYIDISTSSVDIVSYYNHIVITLDW